MSRQTTEERLRGVHERARYEFNRVQSAVREERKQCLTDRRFYSIAGAQWEGPLGTQFENKPRFEVNKVHLSVIRIINEYRNNRITVDFVSKDGVDDDKLADACDGLYRADEMDSGAEEAYDNAFEEAVGGGFGAWRLRTRYEDDEDPENEKQRICFEPIYDADTSVFFDLDSKKQDKSDAKKCWVLISKDRQAYIDEFNDDPASWPKEILSAGMFDWATPDVVYVAEYYEIVEKREDVHLWKLLDGTEQRYSDDELEASVREPEGDEDESTIPTKRDELTSRGAKELRVKKVVKKKVHKYLMSGSKILEDMGIIAGSCIPIIPVYGKRWFVDNIERCMGHVRLAKDAQRLKNMQLSKLGEISALSSVSKPILSPEQIAGHQTMWSEDNVKNYPYLLINPVTDKDGNENVIGPTAYTKSPEIPPSLGALLALTEEDMKDLLGNQQAAEEVVSNIATETADMFQNRVDMQTFIYLSNMAKAVKRCGEIWLSMARDVLVEEGRVMKGVGTSGELSRIELMKPVINEKTAEVDHQNDLGRARFDVNVEVGPSSTTKRAATVRTLIKMASLTEDPETKQVLGGMAMMNMEGEGISDVRRYFRRKLIRMGVVKPNDQEAIELQEEQASQKPSAQDQYLEAAAGQAQAEGAKAQADTIKSQADADKSRAQTLEILHKLDNDSARIAIEAIQKLGPRVVPPSIQGSQVQ
ncbi:MAG: hypothetical protein RLZZ200_531 [Pseudomonadota bacterium]|jgi:hypothetical protein